MHWCAFSARLTPAFENSFVQSSEFLTCKWGSKKRVFSDHAGMKNISAEVSIFCLWTKWIHLVTCSKIEFRELHCCSRCVLDKIVHFRSLFTRVVWPKIIFDLWRRKKRELENNLTIFETCVLNPFHGQKIKRKIFSDGKSRGPL